MSPSIRKLVGTMAILLSLFGWVVGALNIADHLPKHPAASLIFFLVAGLGWGVPLFPLLTWMNRESRPKG